MQYLTKLTSRLRSFNESVNGRIMAAAVTVAMMTAVVKGTAVVKDIVIAHRFGAGDALDCFYVALLLPNFLANIAGESLNASLIPVYIEVLETEGQQKAERLLSSVACCGLVAFLCLATLLGIFRTTLMRLIGGGFDPAKIGLAEVLLVPLLISIGVCGISAVWHAALNAHGRFGASALAPIMIPLLMIASLIALASHWGIYAMVVGSLLGGAGDLIFCGIALRRAGISLLPRWFGLSPALRKVLAQYIPMVAAAVLMGSATLVDQTMAASLSPGSVSALNYANKLMTLPMWIGVHSLSVAVFPSLSELSAKRNWAGIRHVLSIYTLLIVLASVPFTLALAWFSEPLVALVFQGGAFTAQDVHLVARVQTLLCLQLPFYALGILYVRALSALKRNQVLMWGTVINVAVNVVLNVVLMRMIGLPGIALSTSCVYLISCGFLWFMLERVLLNHEARGAYTVSLADSTA
jgi:putative peptidoglycan lipid II flippase